MTTTLCAAPDLSDGGREVSDALVRGNAFAVGDSDLLEVSREIAVYVDTGDDERAEEIALAAFVDAEVRLEHLGIEDLFVAELGFAENVRFEAKLHKVLGASSLDDHLRAFFVNGDRELVLLRKIERVRARFELVSLLTQQKFQFRGLRWRAAEYCKG